MVIIFQLQNRHSATTRVGDGSHDIWSYVFTVLCYLCQRSQRTSAQRNFRNLGRMPSQDITLMIIWVELRQQKKPSDGLIADIIKIHQRWQPAIYFLSKSHYASWIISLMFPSQPSAQSSIKKTFTKLHNCGDLSHVRNQGSHDNQKISIPSLCLVVDLQIVNSSTKAVL
jgi:hypothetical protein